MDDSKKTTLVLWYVPNVIGYVRVLLLLVFLLCAFRLPLVAFWAYFFSASLDALDGYSARRLQQISKFGTCLDYALDRSSIVLLELVLAMIYSAFWMFFAALMVLDVFSHYCQLYYTVFSKTDHHKSKDLQQNRWVSLYYSSRVVLFAVCFSHDAFLLACYIYHVTGYTVFIVIAMIALPGFFFKLGIHVLQIRQSFEQLLKLA